MTLEAAVFLLLGGALAGVAAGLLGIGGGLILVPLLLWVLTGAGVEPAPAMVMAVATALGTIPLTAASAIAAHHRRGAVDWRLVRRLAPWVAAGALAGSLLAAWLGGDLLRRLFAAFAVLMAWRLWRGSPARPFEPPPPGKVAAAISFGIGVLSAMIGIGGGSMTVPWLHHRGLAMARAVAAGSALGYPLALTGSVGYLFGGWGFDVPVPHLGYLYWPGLLLIALATVATAPWGVRLAHRLPGRQVALLFAGFLLAIAVKFAW